MYAFDCICSLLQLASEKVEVVVSDTSDSNELKNRIDSLSISSFKTRLNYFKPEKKFDMTGNHNSAVAAARGKYVCLIGDDDTVTRELVDAAEWADKNNIDCLSPNVVSNYAWPDFRSLSFGAAHSSRLYLPERIGSFARVEGASAILNALANAGQGTDGLPKLYHGLVKREVLEEVRKRSGEYFHGSSPDVSMAVGLSCLLANRSGSFFTIDYPLTIPGASCGSNTGRSAMNIHKGKLESEKQTSAFAANGWSSGVPKFFSVETVWAHACLSTLSAMNASVLIKKYNYSRLLASCLNAHPDFDLEINNALKEAANEIGIDVRVMKRHIKFIRVQLKLRRLRYLARRSMWPTASGGRPFVGGINSIIETPAILQSWLDKRNLSFLDIASRH
jgi:hypothetical protein